MLDTLRTVIIFLFFLFLFTTFQTISVVSITWHDCCDVAIHEDRLVESYQNYIKTTKCYTGQSFEDCLQDYEQRVRDGSEVGLDDFRKVLITDAIAECHLKNKLNKERFLGSCEGVLFCDDIKAEYPGVWFDEETFEDLTQKPFQVSYFAYDLDGTLSKHRRSGSQYERMFVLSTSRFSYLQPKTTVAEFQSKYNDAYAEAKTICEETLNISERLEINGYLEANPLFIPCIDSHIPLSKQERDLYKFYSDWYEGGSDSYISGLAICEETLGFQNDIGLVTFPGQSDGVRCDDEELIDGCCPGFHKDSHFDICCSDGFEGYKGDDGTILCGPAQNDNEITSVTIDLSKSELVLDGNDSIIATLTYFSKSSTGEMKPYSNKDIFHGIVADSETSQYSFSVEKISKKTDSEGRLQVRIRLKNAELNPLGTNIEDLKVHVYSLDQDENDRDSTFFTVRIGDLDITSVDILSDDSVWQNSPVRFKVTVNDPMNEKKMFTLESDSSFKIDSKKDDFIAYYTTKENTFEFTWFAPQISKEIKMNYVKRIADGLVKMGLVAAEDVGGNKLGSYLKDSRDVSLRFKNLNDVYSKMNLLVKTDIQATSGISVGQELVKTAKKPYQYAQTGINSILWMEGTMGILGKPATPLITTLKAGLTGINEWYNLVADLEEIAQSETITLDVPITISVEGLQTKRTDSITKTIPVEGFKMVMSS